jgi:hypothetical protein
MRGFRVSTAIPDLPSTVVGFTAHGTIHADDDKDR